MRLSPSVNFDAAAQPAILSFRAVQIWLSPLMRLTYLSDGGCFSRFTPLGEVFLDNVTPRLANQMCYETVRPQRSNFAAISFCVFPAFDILIMRFLTSGRASGREIVCP